jgi:hypothetical protein
MNRYLNAINILMNYACLTMVQYIPDNVSSNLTQRYDRNQTITTWQEVTSFVLLH